MAWRWGRMSRGVTAAGVLALAIGALLLGVDRSVDSARGMNLLLITMDTTRADFISCLGGDPRITPNLDALAGRSALFERAWSESNATNPSHLSIMTGLHALEHGVLSNYVRIPQSLDTLAQSLKRAGYQTAGFVSAAHLGPQFDWKGFDVLPDVDVILRAKKVTDRALGWLTKRSDRPFFLWVHYFDPHFRYDPPRDVAAKFYQGDPEAGDGPTLASKDYFMTVGTQKVKKRWLGNVRDPAYPRAMYAAEVHYADREIGRLLAAVDSHGLGGNTVMVVVGDHGESLGEHNTYYSHQGLYEQQLRIPLIIHVPGLSPSRSDVPVTTLDIMPTIVESMGVEMRHAMPGLSLLAEMNGRRTSPLANRQVLVHQHLNNRGVAVREGDWKLIWGIHERRKDRPVMAGPQLFNLRDDPGELDDLAPKYPQRVTRMRTLIEPWLQVGFVEPGNMTDLDIQAIERLRSLGYVGD